MRGVRVGRVNGQKGIVENVPRHSPTILQVMDASIPAPSAPNLLAAISTFAVAADSESSEAALWDIWNQVVEYVSKTSTHELDSVVKSLAAVVDLEEPAGFEISGEQVTWKQLLL